MQPNENEKRMHKKEEKMITYRLKEGDKLVINTGDGKIILTETSKVKPHLLNALKSNGEKIKNAKIRIVVHALSFVLALFLFVRYSDIGLKSLATTMLMYIALMSAARDYDELMGEGGK